MSSNSSGKKLERFFTGKGFYIVLFLCAAVIGVSAWMMATGNGTMAEDVGRVNNASLDNRRVETVIIPPVVDETTEVAAPEVNTDGLVMSETPVEDVWVEEETAPVNTLAYVWPLAGELERQHSLEALNYDVTMRDWRTHCGIDIAAPLGATVTAAHCGTVESIFEDEFYGTTVTVDHGDGIKSVYANLAQTPAVNTGDWVEPGSVIGSIGETALCEIGQGTHLHFSMTDNGASVDPLAYLPE